MILRLDQERRGPEQAEEQRIYRCGCADGNACYQSRYRLDRFV